MVLNTILSLLTWPTSDSGENGSEELKAALREPRTELDLVGYFGEPYLDEAGANTAVVPVEVVDREEASVYTQTRLEFEVDDDSGKERFSSFLAEYGLSFESLDGIEGEPVDVELTDSGNIEVNW